ncbi:MAG: riboflavin synthase [Planctomycetales bacterium]
MFTGLVEGLGTVSSISPEGPGTRLAITPPREFAEDCRLGDSIAINGCCLTVVSLARGDWEFQAGPETLARTNLGRLVPGQVVNLERSLPVSARLGGHFVQGHIDGTGSVEQVIPSGEWVTLWFRVPAALARQMVSKGSVAIDGVSLTLVEVERERFSVALIPHTLQVTTLGRRQPGDIVNLETDILAKYVEKLLSSTL